MIDIPEHVIGPERTLLQMFKLFVEPEVNRRQLDNSLPDPFLVTQAQVLFFEGKSPEVRLNGEVKISLMVRTLRPVQAGEAISLTEMQDQIEASELDFSDADAGHFTAIAINDRWVMFFDFRLNRAKASNLLEKAEQFCAAAEHTLSQGHLGPAIDNLFSACELAAKARLMTSAMVRSDTRTHGPIHSRINVWGKLGNVDREFVDIFNKLREARVTARYEATCNDELCNQVNSDMIAKVRAEIDELTTKLKRFSDDP